LVTSGANGFVARILSTQNNGLHQSNLNPAQLLGPC
jgi:hypothetical protein